MYKNKKIIAIIPARGGSKGIPNKNIVKIKGKPLIAYTILSAKKSRYLDKIIVSTDSKKIARVATSFGASVPFLRTKSLATDNAKTIDTIIYTLKKLKEKYDAVVILQPTSPLRDQHDIDKAIELFYHEKKDLVSISKIEINPYLIRSKKKGALTNLVNHTSTIRRQDLSTYYKVNGAIYINKISRLTVNTSLNDNPIGYEMNPSHSLDIDTIDDLNEAKKRL